jgi:hypothetical protein
MLCLWIEVRRVASYWGSYLYVWLGTPLTGHSDLAISQQQG